MKAPMLACAAAALLLAGCATAPATTQSSTTETPAQPMRSALPFDPMPEGATHDHADPSQHHFLWRYNVSSVDHLQANAANIAGLHAIDLQAGYIFGAVYGSHAASVDGGLQIWDAKTDPAHPKALGRWTIPGSVGGDRSIGATQDGAYAVIGLEPVDCLGHVNPLGAVTSAYLIDATDKSTPVVADVVTPAGTAGSPGANPGSTSTHSVYVHRIGTEDYAFIFGDIYHIARGEAGGAKLQFVSHVSTGHDIYVRDTPWNRTWALSANGGGGLAITDVTDPAKPFEIATWDREDHQDIGWYFHTADVAFVGDQAVIVLTSEDFGPHVSPFWVLDGNPLRGVVAKGPTVKLTEMGSWSNPYNHTAANIRFSLHNPRFTPDGILSVSSYHAGIWQFDFRTPDSWSNPNLIAQATYADGDNALVIDPVESTVESNLCGLGITIDAPEAMDVAPTASGILYVADVFGGLYTFVPTADHPVYGAPAHMHPTA